MRSGNTGINIISRILRNAVLILFLIIFVSIVYNFRNQESTTESALMTEAVSSTSFSGVFIRDERIVTYNGNGVISYNVVDGGRLGNGSVIAQIYDSDDQITINKDINRYSSELDLLSKIQNPGTIESVQPTNLSSAIDEAYRNLIYSKDIGAYSDINAEKDDFLILLSTYQTVTDEANVDFSSRVNDVTVRMAELTASSLDPKETIVSDRSAYFVSYCDGYEETLTKDSIDSVSKSKLEEVTEKRCKYDNVLGKLVDGYSWYIAGVVDNSKKFYTEGKFVKLKFEYSDDTFDAKIISVRDTGNPDEAIVVISCEQFTYDLVQHRCAEVEVIEKSSKGLKVPREAIRFLPTEETEVDEETGIETTVMKNYKGVYVREGEQISFRRIDVIYEGGDFVLSKPHKNENAYLAMYDDIMVEGVENDG